MRDIRNPKANAPLKALAAKPKPPTHSKYRGYSVPGLANVRLQAQVQRWNAQPDELRTRRIGVAKGVPFNSFAARAKLPFSLPPGATLSEDGSIKLRKRP